MDELKYKQQYTNIQIKLFNYVNMLDNLLNQYIVNSKSVSYKRITYLNKTINRLILHSEKIKNNLIYLQFIA